MASSKIPKALTSIYAANTLVFSLATSSVADAAERGPVQLPGGPVQAQPQEEREHVVGRAHGLKVSITISGRPGRHCAMFYNTGARDSAYQIFPGSPRVIGRAGSVIMTLDMASFLGKQGFLKVVTAATSDFATDVRETESVAVQFAQEVRTAISNKGIVDGYAARRVLVREQRLPAAVLYPGVVDINRATVETLRDQLGVSEAFAKEIVRYRPFKDVEELRRVPGLSAQKFEEIKARISVDFRR